jgi:hypothetical protein
MADSVEPLHGGDVHQEAAALPAEEGAALKRAADIAEALQRIIVILVAAEALA